MPRKVNFRRSRATARALRLKIAQWVAPTGADVHDPDDTACPEVALLLADVFFARIERRAGIDYLDVTEHLETLASYGLARRSSHGWWLLTDAGEHELGRRWGPDRVPPWARASLGECEKHGDHDQLPGDLLGCPKCRLERSLLRASGRPPGHAL